MKRTLLLLGLLVFVFAGVSITPKPEPVPVEAKPVLLEEPRAWIIRNDTGKHIVGYYCKVLMPDGSRPEIKIQPAPTATPTTPLPATSVWQAKADALWEAQKAAELNKPQPCSHCGGTGIEL